MMRPEDLADATELYQQWLTTKNMLDQSSAYQLHYTISNHPDAAAHNKNNQRHILVVSTGIIRTFLISQQNYLAVRLRALGVDLPG